jgi:hypothetical protein
MHAETQTVGGANRKSSGKEEDSFAHLVLLVVRSDLLTQYQQFS